ncbi:MAG TPA: serine protease [Solirubrobacteraceae bacterium]
MKLRRLPVLLAIACAFAAFLSTAGSAAAWAPASSATIHPGVMTFTGGPSFLEGGGQCTANFVYTDASGNVYLGQAAHCSSTGEDTETNGCSTKSLPLGAPIYAGDLVNGGLQKGTKIGTLAYNSWIAMREAKEKNPETCAYNDLALIKIDSSQVGKVNPTVPFWGGPNGLASGVAATGSQVFTYGNSILRLGVSVLSPKTGVSLGESEESGGWSQQVYTVTPGIPGDSGSAYMDASGNALGVLSTVEFAPVAGSNGVGSLPKELEYANKVTGLGITVAPGTTAFNAVPVPPAE